IPAAIVGVVAYAVSPREGIYSGQRPGFTKDLRDPKRRANAEPPRHA
ncbi:MAG: hypothetical protein RLZ19_757, partial [Actinomycetota bacterium]